MSNIKTARKQSKLSFRQRIEKCFSKMSCRLKKDVSTQHSDYKYILLKFAIIAISLISSLFWAPFVFVVLIEALLFACSQFNGRAVYYLFFILPFMQVFRFNPSDTYFFTYVVVAVCFTLGVKLLVDILHKKRKIDWLFSISVLLFALYITIPRDIGAGAVKYWGSLMLGVILVFLCKYYKDDIQFKELVFSFLLGFLFSCSLATIRDITRIPTMVGTFYSYSRRFTAGYINPNVLMGEGLICVASLMVLFLRNDVKLIFFPLLVLVVSLTLLTISKVSFFIVVLLFCVFVVLLFCRKLTKKELIYNLFALLFMGVCLIVCIKPIGICLGRFKKSDESNQDGLKSETITDKEDFVYKPEYENDDIIVVVGNKIFNLTELSTGRFNIWKTYLNASTKDVKSLLFGYGVGAPFIGEWRGWKGWQPHNTFIQALYYVGIVGYLLIFAIIGSLVYKKNFKNFNWYSLLILLVACVYLCDAEFFSFRLGIYCVLIGFAATLKNKNDNWGNSIHGVEDKKNQIPKKIHYIWLGGKPLPKIAEECIESWKKYCPDYEIKQWNESNLNIDCCTYCRDAYDAKKYAFASDVLRFDILSKEGGVYLDIDVKLFKPLDNLLNHECFMGFEHNKAVAPGLIMGCVKDSNVVFELYQSYRNDKFILDDGTQNLKTICTRTTNYLVQKGLKLDNSLQEIEGVVVYPTEFFCPLSPITNKKEVTNNTYAMHLYYSSWYNKKAKIKKTIKKLLNFLTNGWFGIILYKHKNKGCVKND